ncbi:MAG: glycosyltransferase family 4 protein [Candidatus Dormibacteraeota bacterium]|nr:glycosyltransferase family 4 protein [Candidatus Dormibacteraeota bacterium]
MVRVLLEASCLVDARRDAGIGRYARNLIANLEHGADLDIGVARPQRPPLSESRPGRFIHAQPPALRAAARMKPDLLHGLGGEPVAGFPLSRQVVTIHDVEMWRTGGADQLRHAALRAYGITLAALLRECGAYIAVSRTSADEAIQALRLRRSRVHVVPEGVTAAFTALPDPADAAVLASLDLVAGRYVFWAGSMRHRDPRKGLDLLIEAVGRLGAEGPPLVLAGSTGAEAERLTALAARRSCRIVLTGRRGDHDLAALYRNAAVFALASTHEGFGLSALEAMACGVPVVATAAGNLPDLCGNAALLVPVGDAAALSGGLRAVLDSSTRAAGMREAGVARSASFTWERTARDTAHIYRSLAADLTGRRRSPRAVPG